MSAVRGVEHVRGVKAASVVCSCPDAVQSCLCLPSACTNEVAPLIVGSAGCRPGPCSFQNAADRRAAHPVTEPLQLAVDAFIPPLSRPAARSAPRSAAAGGRAQARFGEPTSVLTRRPGDRCPAVLADRRVAVGVCADEPVRQLRAFNGAAAGLFYGVFVDQHPFVAAVKQRAELVGDIGLVGQRHLGRGESPDPPERLVKHTPVVLGRRAGTGSFW